MSTIYKDGFIQFLKEQTGNAKLNGSKTEIVCNCPWCEGNIKKNHGHLYISTNDPIFMCHKCGQSGIVTRLIKQLNADPATHISTECLQAGLDNRISSNKFNTNDIKLNTATTTDTTRQLDYLKFRLGNIDANLIPGVVLNVAEFSTNNSGLNIIPPTNPDNYLGFVTYNKTKLICRNLEPECEYRYSNVMIDSSPRFFKDFYGIKLANLTEPVIILTEGIFNVLNVVYNHSTFNFPASMIAATLGKSNYRTVLYSVMNELRILKTRLIILSDADVSNDDYRRMFFYYKRKKHPSLTNLTIIRNNLGGDFGDKDIAPDVLEL